MPSSPLLTLLPTALLRAVNGNEISAVAAFAAPPSFPAAPPYDRLPTSSSFRQLTHAAAADADRIGHNGFTPVALHLFADAAAE